MSKSAETSEAAAATQSSLAKDTLNLLAYYTWRAAGSVRSHLGTRRGLIFLAVAILGVAAAFNWTWLVAVGIAPILVAVAPCAAMCALGLCMNKMGGGSCSSTNRGATPSAAETKPTQNREDV